MLKVIFFISGFCSLLYQVVWQRLFGLVCSSDNITAAVVVAAFLFGIGTGNFFAAWLTRRTAPKTAFRLLAFCESLITLFAVASPILYYDILFAYFLENTFTLLQTFAVLFLSLLPSTFLMGMSMPLLGRGVVEKAEDTASVLGGLYAANIAGAGTGAFTASFWLLGTLGMEVSLYFGAALNLVAAAALWLLPHRFQSRQENETVSYWKLWAAFAAVGILFLYGSAPSNYHSVLFRAIIPGGFLLASAIAVSPWRNAFSSRVIILAATISGLACALSAGSTFLFLHVSAALALMIRYVPGSSHMLRQGIKSLGAALILSAAAWYLGQPDWGAFHYLLSAYWLFGPPREIAAGSQRRIVPAGLGAIAFLCIPMLAAGRYSQAAAAALGAAAFLCCAIVIFRHDGQPLRPYSSSRLHLIPLVASAAAVYTVCTDWLPAVLVVLTGEVCIRLWKAAAETAFADCFRFSARIWMMLAFASGFAAVALEMIWFRTLFISFSGNTYIFGPMLGVFLICDGLGVRAAAGLVKKIRNYGFAFLCVQAAAAAAALLMYHVYLSLPDMPFSRLQMTAGSLVLMGIPCFFLGFTFPLIQEAIQDDSNKIGARIGNVLFFNTLGNTAGGAAAAFVLLGFLGTSGSLAAAALIPAAAALYCLARRTARLSMAALLLTAAVLCFTLPKNADFWMRIHRLPAHSKSIVAEDYSGVCLITVGSTAGGFFLDSGITSRGTLYVSGYRQGDIPFGINQTMSGILGPAFHPNPEEVLCIGIGSAATPYLMGMRNSVKRIDMIELAAAEIPALQEAAQHDFGAFLGKIFTDPRYRLFIEDGRKFLFNSGRYDIIQADMRTARSAGSGAIYSREFFRQAREHLKPGGYLIQQNFGRNVTATMRTVFPYVYRSGSFLIGSVQPLTVSRQKAFSYFDRELAVNIRSAGLNPVPIRTILENHFRDSEFILLPPPEPGAAINTDLMPADEFYLNSPLPLCGLSLRKWLLPEVN